MKRLLLVLVLTLSFQSLIKADDIRDFEIEGISVGDSLLDHFTESQIKNGIPESTLYKSDKYIRTHLRSSEFKTYEMLQFHYKKNSNYKIFLIAGGNFIEDIKDCHDQMIEMDKELSTMFENTERIESGTIKHRADPTGNSTFKSINYFLKNNDGFRISCFDWSEKLTKERNYFDHIKLNIFTKEIREWFNNEAYD